jgi:translocation and assembly module TamA
LNIKFTPYIYILFFILNICGAKAQNLKLSIKTNQSSDQEVLNQIPFKKELPSKVALENELDSLLDKLEFRGYLNAKLDTIIASDTASTAFFSLGEKINSIKIYYGHISSSLLTKKELDLYVKEITDTYFEIPFSEIQASMQTLADHFEKKGNSFVRVSLREFILVNAEATAQLYIEDNQQRTIDKVIVKGYENFPKSYILHELRLKTGSVFNKEKLKLASQAIVNLPFVEELKPPEVLFTSDSTLVYLYLKKKRSNQFDGIIGFASKEESSGLEFNGYLDLTINNIFNSGETIALYWKNNGNDSQRFFLEAELPYIFNLPLIPKANFQLYRQDSTYSNVTTHVSLGYSLGPKGKLTALLSTEKSTDLTSGTSNGIESYSNLFYGLSYSFKKMDNDLIFPVKFQFNIDGMLGSRNSEELTTSQARFLFQASYLFSINAKNYIFTQNQSGILNSDSYLTNELFRIGGINNIRGVNEESIFASAYSVFNLEYRFKPNESSYFYSISDFSYAENKIDDQKINVISLGLGYAFTTKAGVLNLSYAIGKYNNAPFTFGDSKVHIKIISNF